jgi:hypothetical protein
MNTKNKANRHHISIEELAISTVAEIMEDLSDGELNGITGGISSTGTGPIDLDPIKTSGCSACCSGYDPRFEDKKATYM